ncbi:reverse transcriptase domain-containing protein [Metabacillus fastidiosus]|uniref:reverse transcriptase domain-containing protein n=1 Tax=Metabacillus fastidiosus TaxID=1458 RepID=UPI002E1FAC3A|nr:reverse transcriptase domain-containing protein [Metabacillus fastidiosus]
MRQRIRTRKYQRQAALRVEILKENGKMRKWGIPTVVDRVVQQAIHQVLSPIFEKQFSEFSNGFRPRRSCEREIVKSLEFLECITDYELRKREAKNLERRMQWVRFPYVKFISALFCMTIFRAVVDFVLFLVITASNENECHYKKNSYKTYVLFHCFFHFREMLF